MDDATEKGLKYQAQYYRTKKKNTKLGEEVTTLLASIQDLKKEFAFNDETMHVLCNAASQIPAALFERCNKMVTDQNMKKSYPDTLRTFAFTLHLYSPAAYR